jgi:pilus assembly protein CpaF
MVSEFQINDIDNIYYKERGKLNRVFEADITEDDMRDFVREVAKEQSPRFLAETTMWLEDDSVARVHIVLPPVSRHPMITIARKLGNLLVLDELQKTGAFDDKVKTFLKKCVRANQTMVVSGPTGAGKTTILEAITRELPIDLRIGVVEDSPELQLVQDNVVYLASTQWQPGQDEKNIAPLSWCIRQLNRQRVARVIVGETRGVEFADFLVAANSGCEGSLTTIHANNPRLALQKMTNFVNLATGQSERAINKTIVNTIDIIIQLDLYGHKHKISSIESLSGTLGAGEEAAVSTQPIFKYNPGTDVWDYKGFIDDKLRRAFQQAGIDLTQ